MPLATSAHVNPGSRQRARFYRAPTLPRPPPWCRQRAAYGRWSSPAAGRGRRSRVTKISGTSRAVRRLVPWNISPPHQVGFSSDRACRTHVSVSRTESRCASATAASSVGSSWSRSAMWCQHPGGTGRTQAGCAAKRVVDGRAARVGPRRHYRSGLDAGRSVARPARSRRCRQLPTTTKRHQPRGTSTGFNKNAAPRGSLLNGSR